jgi:hypothetical protein
MDSKGSMFIYRDKNGDIVKTMAKLKDKRIVVQKTDKGNYFLTFKRISDNDDTREPCKWKWERGILTTNLFLTEEAMIAIMESTAHYKGLSFFIPASYGHRGEKSPPERHYPESFLHWVAYHYIRAHGGWWHKYQAQTKDNLQSTEDLYKFWVQIGKKG